MRGQVPKKKRGQVPVGGIVVGVVSGLGAALLGVTEHRITEERLCDATYSRR